MLVGTTEKRCSLSHAAGKTAAPHADDAFTESLIFSSTQRTSKCWFSSSSFRRTCSWNTVSRELAGLSWQVLAHSWGCNALSRQLHWGFVSFSVAQFPRAT